MHQNQKIQTAFVSTSSITQGEQTAILWQPLLNKGIKLQFAHRTFKWSNEGKGVAAVHCVIIGFSFDHRAQLILFDYPDISGAPVQTIAENISPYLVDSPNIIVTAIKKQISNELIMINGSKPTDGGNLILSDSEKKELITIEPNAIKYIRQFYMGNEFINSIDRWCLWFADLSLTELIKDLNSMPNLEERIESVKKMRLASTDKQTQKDAATPHLFQKIRQPSSNYLAIPSVSSESRHFIPIGYLSSDIICGNKLFSIANAELYHFGILNSTMHNAFMRTVVGRLKSDYNYSNTIVYNNFPFPFQAEERQGENIPPAIKKAVAKIEQAAQNILDQRQLYIQQAKDRGETPPSLADLYKVGLIDAYPELTRAHQQLDKAVDAAYGYKGKHADADRVAFLFARYQQLITLQQKPKK